MSQIINQIEEYLRKTITSPQILSHHLRTRDYLLILDPNISLEAKVAALTHDLERQFPNPVPFPERIDDQKYLLAHGKSSAKVVIDYLRSQKFRLNYKRLEQLITNHEVGGDPESDLIRDADSISFLEVVAPYFLKKHGKEEAKDKLSYMFKRIENPQAKKLARPLYQKAMQLLD